MGTEQGGESDRARDPSPDDRLGLLDEALLHCIAVSDALSARLAEAPSEEHRRAIVDIHAYLGLLAALTELPQEEVKKRLGCRREVETLPDWSKDELTASRDFLALVSEVCLACERPPSVVCLALDLAILTFRLARFDNITARQALQHSEGEQSALSALANHDLVTAYQIIENFPGFYQAELLATE